MQFTMPSTEPDVPSTLRVSYEHATLTELLASDQILAIFGFGASAPMVQNHRYTRVQLQTMDANPPFEVWRTAPPLSSGAEHGLRWSEGGGWLFMALETDEAELGPEGAARCAYLELTRFLQTRPEYQVQRLWNYIDAINRGDGDQERYKQFCSGRLSGMRGYFADGFPAATAIGQSEATGRLQVYCLAATSAGTRIENPRQISAWHYPRQYGPVAPSFARAMRLPAGDALAISGTAAINGHQSRHEGNLQAQLSETLTNLHSLLEAGGMPAKLGRHTPLKVYLRNPAHAAVIREFLDQHAPDAPRLMLQADICRRELLVEIDGWSFAST